MVLVNFVHSSVLISRPFPGSVLVYVASSSALGFGKDSVCIELLLFFMTMPTPKVNEEKLVLKLRSLRTFF